MKILFVIIALLFSAEVQAQIVEDAASSAQTTANSSLSWSHTTSSGTNRAMYVGVGSSAATPDLTTTVSYAGSSTGWVELWDVIAQTFFHNSGHYVKAPATGTNTISITIGSTDDELLGLAYTMTGVDQTTPVNTTPTATNGLSTTATSNTITSAVGELIVGHSYAAWNGANAAGGATEKAEQIISAADTGTLLVKAGGSATLSSTAATAGTNEWIINGISFKSATPPSIALTGTVTAAITEADIVTGGKTIILTATADTFAAVTKTVSYVGGQVGGFAGTTTAQDITFALTGGSAATPAAGDLVVAFYCVASTVDRALAIRTTGAVDYTLIGSEQYINGTFDTNLRAAYRFMPGTPETAIRFTETVGGGTGAITDAGRYNIEVFRNIDTTTPLDVAAVVSSSTTTRVADPGSITPTTTGAYISIGGCGSGGTGGTYTSTLTDFKAGTTADTNDSFNGAGYNAWTSGAFDQAAYGGGGTNVANDTYAVYVVALRPAVWFDSERTNIANGCDSAQAEGTGWDAVVKPNIPVANVVRTSNTVVTITLQAQATYNITAQETVTCTVPATALAGGSAIAATPTFTIDFSGGGVTTKKLLLFGMGFIFLLGRKRNE